PGNGWQSSSSEEEILPNATHYFSIIGIAETIELSREKIYFCFYPCDTHGGTRRYIQRDHVF
ncbi:hypothetical protein, partial [Escherichia coli]|uniref:hypothetical protein n=1 Tax=Escherichia coli TaxID=562 RepID=UPI001F1FD6BB